LKDGHLQATRDGGHTVLIVGCNEDQAATEFLYIDPYPGGSTMKYKGGIAADSYPSKCFFLVLGTLVLGTGRLRVPGVSVVSVSVSGKTPNPEHQTLEL